MAAISVIVISAVSGAAGTDTPTARSAFLSPTLRSAPVGGAPKREANAAVRGKCPSAHKAVRFYAGRIAYWRSKIGGESGRRYRLGRSQRPVSSCPHYLAHVLQRKAYAVRKAYMHWLDYHFHWQSWLPDKWARIGACETGYGRRPGSWTWDSGTYVSAFGIYRAGYTQFAHEIGQLGWDETRSRLGRYPTPREQYNVAARIAYHFGYGAWGCGGA